MTQIMSGVKVVVVMVVAAGLDGWTDGRGLGSKTLISAMVLF